MNDTSIIEATLAKKLAEAEPTLDIRGSDKKIQQIAYHDLLSFAEFNRKPLDELGDSYIVAESVARYIEENRAEAEDFIGAWAGLWLAKWKQRVKLVLGSPSKSPEKTTTNASAATVAKEIDNEEEILNLITSTLVKHGEICGTEIIAENILKSETAKTGNVQLTPVERTFTILSGCLRRAREISQNSGPIIFVRVDKGYYSTVRSQLA